MGAGDLLGHVQGLLAAGEWEAAALHLRFAAQHVPSRDMACQYRDLCKGVPAEVRESAGWPEALAWVGFRSDDPALVAQAVQVEFSGRAVFQAFVDLRAEKWGDVLRRLEGAGELPGLLGGLGARFRAMALFELGDSAVEEAYVRALEQTSGRDHGLVWSELGYVRSRMRRDEEARDAYAKARVWLREDVSELTLAHANLGIACLRLNDLTAAEFALQDARRCSERPGGARRRSTVWRLIGGAGMQRRLPARAIAAFESALETAPDGPDRLLAARGLARALMAARRFDQALAVLYEGLGEVPPEEPNPLWLDVAVVLLQTGNVPGAQAVLAKAGVKSPSDGWRRKTLEAELLRRQGEVPPPAPLDPWPTDQNWVREEAWLFPELFRLWDVAPEWPQPRGVVVADGPIRLFLDRVQIPLAAHRHEAALLAFLAAQGGASTTDRVLEALRLPGKDRREQLKELSRAVRALAQTLGWREAVTNEGGLLHLTPEIAWDDLVYPPPERSDLFCEGRLDPWVIEWRQENLRLLRSII